jgi:hypothetical protein
MPYGSRKNVFSHSRVTGVVDTAAPLLLDGIKLTMFLITFMLRSIEFFSICSASKRGAWPAPAGILD